ncbi:CGNR zinc finger domain-containing protein [Streptomyces sp. UG1]|uniref:CGNR zinc finger domain-containing protein n=1 Tax=Streptomyces sp. UG1 TaxID=3417652 RepID=UPI003CEC237E
MRACENSKNNSARWCSMPSCGNRMKTHRRHNDGQAPVPRPSQSYVTQRVRYEGRRRCRGARRPEGSWCR